MKEPNGEDNLLLVVFIVLILVCFLISCSTKKNKEYTLKYVVFYPGYRDTVIVKNNKGFYWGSNRGSNYINNGSITSPNVYDGSAPFKVLKYEIL